MQNPSGPSYPLASLYVGDLHPDVTEAMLFEKFSTAGQVLSIRVCRDMMTRRSLGYAYVNFQLAQDAERAMDSMNYDSMKGRPVRIMWSQRDPSLRRSGFGNIFIKNLDKQIDNKSMYDTFSGFGAILSCKVAQDETGQSRGYAFVHFELESSAVQAIEKVNGMLLNGKKVFVGRFVPRAERDKAYGDGPRKFTNVFVKNFGDNMDEDKLRALFEKFGPISSLRVMVDDSTGKSKGFGFVSFDTAEAAEEAVNALNGSDVNGSALFVGRAQKRAERQQELRRQFEMKRQERQNRFAGVNLYVKNLDETIDDDMLKKEFSHIGQINSAKIMRENGRSKGFGFVCFNTPEEASKAVAELNGKVIGNKPLYVAMAQRKEERRNVMAHQMMSRFVPTPFQQRPPMPGQMGFPAGAIQGQMAPPYLYPANMAQAQRGYFPAAAQPMGQMQGMGMMRAPQRWNNQGPYAPRGQQPGGPYQQQQMQQQGMQGGQGQGPPQFRPQGPRGMRPPGAMGGPRGMPPGGVPPGMGGQQGIPQQQQQQGPNAAQQQGAPRPQQNGVNGPVSGGVRTGAPTFIRPAGQPMPRSAAPNTQHAPQSTNISGIDAAALAKAPTHEQKQILGEKLFPLISQTYPDLAGKVTGMLLEIDNSELLLMLEQPEQLKGKVDEAVNVLKSHLGGAPGATAAASVAGKAGGAGDAVKQDGQK